MHGGCDYPVRSYLIDKKTYSGNIRHGIHGSHLVEMYIRNRLPVNFALCFGDQSEYAEHIILYLSGNIHMVFYHMLYIRKAVVHVTMVMLVVMVMLVMMIVVMFMLMLMMMLVVVIVLVIVIMLMVVIVLVMMIMHVPGFL